VRLDLRITNLLVIFKKQYNELENELGNPPCKDQGGGAGAGRGGAGGEQNSRLENENVI